MKIIPDAWQRIEEAPEGLYFIAGDKEADVYATRSGCLYLRREVNVPPIQVFWYAWLLNTPELY